MAAELVIHIPAAQTSRFYPLLAEAAQGRAGVRRDKTIPSLALGSLRCLNISLFGSGEHVRTPFVFPFLGLDGFNLETPDVPLHELPGPDWLVLGGGPAELAGLASGALAALARSGPEPLLRVRPFAGLEGPLPQDPQPEDLPFRVRKSSKNFNQADWVTTRRKLLELPEERWGEAGIANTVDQLHVFDDALGRLAPREPRLVVDLGCGLGQITRSLALRYPAARVAGLDASPEAIAVARNAFRLKNLSYAVVDFSKPLGFDKGQVDLIVSTNALPYAQDQLATARELFGLLAPDGLLLNHCRAEESHLFWDFPGSLLLPTSTQIFLADWHQAAREAGLGTEVWTSPLGLTSTFYSAYAFKPFAEAMDAYAREHRLDGPGEYAPWMSHVLLAHGRHVRGQSPPPLSRGHNHLARLDMALASAVLLPREMQRTAISAWLANSRSLDLFPEALDVMTALLPGAAPLVRAALSPGRWQR